MHRRGYRFLAPVSMADPPEPAPGDAPLQRAALVLTQQEALPSAPSIPTPRENADTLCCAICKHPQNRAARFCVGCGAPHVELYCACDQAMSMPATFCPGCGQ